MKYIQDFKSFENKNEVRANLRRELAKKGKTKRKKCDCIEECDCEKDKCNCEK